MASGLSAKRPAAAAGPSTTAITPSTVTRVRTSGQLNAFTSGLGSASPLVSITICSGGLGRSSKARMVGRKSSATVQQMQPLASSTMFSSGQPSILQPFTNSPSTPVSPNSLMMSAMRLPLALRSRFWIRVVLPAPRKPVTTVAGILPLILSVPSFQAQRQTRRHEKHGVRNLRDALVHASRVVAEGARQRVVRHDAEPDLVRDEDHRSARLPERADQVLCLLGRVAAGRHQIAEPQGQAIHQNRRPLFRFSHDRGADLERRLDGAPMRLAPRLVLAHALRHLVIADLGSRDIDAASRMRDRDPFGVAALA